MYKFKCENSWPGLCRAAHLSINSERNKPEISASSRLVSRLPWWERAEFKLKVRLSSLLDLVVCCLCRYCFLVTVCHNSAKRYTGGTHLGF